MASIIKIKTDRFGEIEIDAGKIIRFLESLPGLPESLSFVLIPHKEDSPFMWFQSTELSNLAFIVIDPYVCVGEYNPSIEAEDLKSLSLGGYPDEDALMLGMVSIPQDVSEMTVNLVAPILINLKTKLAKQVILDDCKYSIRQKILP
ncbi:MAG: flagellar assembly protein FliW [Actinomycetota bacterium]|nr:flagellar assembly protein FliW [Actinomycetota bacterium]